MYMKDLFRKGVYVVSNSNDYKNYRQDLVGYVAKETEDLIVVFSEFDKKLRFDVPKSEITVAGSSVIIEGVETLQKYTTKRDAPLPQGKSLRPSADEISGKTISAASVVIQQEQATAQEAKRNTVTLVAATPVQPTRGMGTNLIATNAIASEPFAGTQDSGIKTQESGISLLQTSSKEVALERMEEVSKGLEPPSNKELEGTSIVYEEDHSQAKGQTESPDQRTEETSIVYEEDHSQAKGQTESPDQRTEEGEVFAAESKPALTNEAIGSSSLKDYETNQQGVDEHDVNMSVKTGTLTKTQDAYMTGALPERSTLTESPTQLTLWEDYILFGIQLYGELTRQFVKINENWFNTFWSSWREISRVSEQSQKD